MGAYERHLAAEHHQVGKENTQRIEGTHLNRRTRIKRLVRRTLCFSKTEHMHDLIIRLFINRYEFDGPYETGSTLLRHLLQQLPGRPSLFGEHLISNARVRGCLTWPVGGDERGESSYGAGLIPRWSRCGLVALRNRGSACQRRVQVE